MDKRLFKTELEALISCRNHWQFMWITGSKSKDDYEPARKWNSYCAVCEWDGYNLGTCRDCPLSGYAWKVFCNSTKSFWRGWLRSKSINQRRFWANRMVYACNQAIENYLLNKED